VDKGADTFDASRGECHSVSPKLKNKKGPSLFAVAGRPAAQVEGFDYSEAMKSCGIVWTDEQVDADLEAPQKRVPGGKMKFDGMPKPEASANVIAFLKAQHQSSTGGSAADFKLEPVRPLMQAWPLWGGPRLRASRARACT